MKVPACRFFLHKKGVRGGWGGGGVGVLWGGGGRGGGGGGGVLVGWVGGIGGGGS